MSVEAVEAPRFRVALWRHEDESREEALERSGLVGVEGVEVVFLGWPD